MDKYCRKCGTELIKELCEGFNADTGEQNFRMICPIRKCEHTGTDHIDVYRGIFTIKVTCARAGCNHVRELYDF